MKFKKQEWLVLSGCFSFAVALLHIVIIFVGEAGYRYFGAGEKMAELASSGSAIPALLTLVITMVFIIWGLYAFSGAGLIRRLPFLRPILVVITAIYILRGLGIFVQIFWLIKSPESTPLHYIVFSFAALVIGLTHLAGVISNRESLNAK